MTDLIAKHGGYKNLKSFQNAEIVFDLTFEFCKLYVKSFKMKEQMEGAARGGKQNISEGSYNSGTSKQTEIRLLNVARGSQEELKNDFEDYLRTNHLPIWDKNDVRVLEIRNLVYKTDRTNKSDRIDRTNKTDKTNRTNRTNGADRSDRSDRTNGSYKSYGSNRSYETYRSYLENPESGANCILCLIHQTNFLLDQQLKKLGQEFKTKGDFNERKIEIKKEKIFGNNEDEYLEILKESGFKKLENGRIIPIDHEEEEG